jgi:hypothetical protein
MKATRKFSETHKKQQQKNINTNNIPLSMENSGFSFYDVVVYTSFSFLQMAGHTVVRRTS